MPRIRSIRPEFWTRRKLASSAPAVRLVMVGLIQLADDWGRLEGETVILRSQLFPAGGVTQPEFDRAVELLASLGEIVLYREDDAPFVAIPGWKDRKSWQYQQINKPQPSRLPEPPPDSSRSAPAKARTATAPGPDDTGIDPAPQTDTSRTTPEPLPERSGSVPGGSREQGTGRGKDPPLPSRGEGLGSEASPRPTQAGAEAPPPERPPGPAPLSAGERAKAQVIQIALGNVRLRVETPEERDERKRAAEFAVDTRHPDQGKAKARHEELVSAERARRTKAREDLLGADAAAARYWIELLQAEEPVRVACLAAAKAASRDERDVRRAAKPRQTGPLSTGIARMVRDLRRVAAEGGDLGREAAGLAQSDNHGIAWEEKVRDLFARVNAARVPEPAGSGA